MKIREEPNMSRIKAMACDIVRLRWRLVAFVFFIGILLRLPMLSGQHREGDEVIYMSLVGQLDEGHGYTLQKSALVERGIVDRYQYDRPLFFHPPGGIALFWLAHQMFGDNGYPVVQIVCFALFFWSMLFLAHCLKITRTDTGLLLVALLSSFNPIMAHVTTKFWLDAPLLAFATLGAALFLYSFIKKNVAIAVVAGIIIGYASLIKLTAFLIMPGIFLVSIATACPLKWRTFARHALYFAIPAVIAQVPWEIWQWVTVGSPFPQWAGKPSESLIRSNRYVHFLTVVRSPWIYLTTTSMVMTTIVPSAMLLMLFYARRKDDRSIRPGDTHGSMSCIRATATACLLWISIVIAFHMALGFVGYSILLRYVILLTPASILLPSLLVPHFMEQRSRKGSLVSRLELPVLLCTAAGIVVEVATGINAALHVDRALIIPFTGL
jgi:4-amino-4-deoxy-L-arabinose transferase-like glycosyltransferase